MADHDEPGACRGRCPESCISSGCSGCPNFCSSTEWCSPEQTSSSRCFVFVGFDGNCLRRLVLRTAPAVTGTLLQTRPRAVRGPPPQVLLPEEPLARTRWLPILAAQPWALNGIAIGVAPPQHTIRVSSHTRFNEAATGGCDRQDFVGSLVVTTTRGSRHPPAI